MTVIGLDDTDSRERGMCTTYVASEVARRLRDAGATVERLLLVRLNPAVEYKTRGNAALAVHTDADPETALSVAREVVGGAAETPDPNTNPGIVVAPHDPGPRSDDPNPGRGRSNPIPEPVAAFALAAIRDRLEIEDARELVDARGYRHAAWKNGRGLVGALAAIGAWAVLDDWTYETISYREPARWGTGRDVDEDSVFRAADAGYPTVWDTVDRGEREAVCVPHTPGPVLFGIRGDDPDVTGEVARAIDSEPVHRRETFLTNQGTDLHLRDGTVDGVEDGRAYRVTGTVVSDPESRRGGHVFFRLEGDGGADGVGEDGGGAVGENAIRCAAFEPTKRFRERVRGLCPGDRISACGEVARGTLKLEKFAVRDLVRTERVTPTCPDCDRRMESAGAGQGYRCRECGTTAEGRIERPLDRDLEEGWYEVPPCARRHISKPLVRGGFDAPVHPER